MSNVVASREMALFQQRLFQSHLAGTLNGEYDEHLHLISPAVRLGMGVDAAHQFYRTTFDAPGKYDYLVEGVDTPSKIISIGRMLATERPGFLPGLEESLSSTLVDVVVSPNAMKVMCLGRPILAALEVVSSGIAGPADEFIVQLSTPAPSMDWVLKMYGTLYSSRGGGSPFMQYIFGKGRTYIEDALRLWPSTWVSLVDMKEIDLQFERLTELYDRTDAGMDPLLHSAIGVLLNAYYASTDEYHLHHGDGKLAISVSTMAIAADILRHFDQMFAESKDPKELHALNTLCATMLAHH